MCHLNVQYKLQLMDFFTLLHLCCAALCCETNQGHWSTCLADFGCSGGTVLAIVDLLEEAGLPPLCIAVAEEVDGDRVVGEVLAEAIKVWQNKKDFTCI